MPPLIALWLFHTVASVGIVYVGSLSVFSRWFAELTCSLVPNEGWQIVLIFVCCSSVLFSCYACVMWYLYDVLLMRIRNYELLHKQLSTFEVANLNCAVESDRAVVHEQIKRLFGSIDKFEELVRTKVAPFISRGAVTSMPYALILLASSPHVWLLTESLALWPNLHMLATTIGIVGSGDFLGMYALGVIVRQLHGQDEEGEAIDDPLLRKLGVDRWSESGKRILGILTATAANALIVGALSTTASPNIPVGAIKISCVIALGVFSVYLTNAKRTSKTGRAGYKPEGAATQDAEPPPLAIERKPSARSNKLLKQTSNSVIFLQRASSARRRRYLEPSLPGADPAPRTAICCSDDGLATSIDSAILAGRSPSPSQTAEV